MKVRSVSILVSLMVVLWCGVTVGGILVIDDGEHSTFEDWRTRNANPPPAGAYGTVTNGAVGGRTGLSITGGAASESPKEDMIYTDTHVAGDKDYTDFMGDGGGVAWLSFRFYAPQRPGGLSVYFYSSTSGTYWYFDIDAALGWNRYDVGFGDGTGWWKEGAGTFASDLQDVDELGLALTYRFNDGSQVFGLDDVALHTPEPGTYAVLAFVFVSLGITFRKKLAGSLGLLCSNLR